MYGSFWCPPSTFFHPGRFLAAQPEFFERYEFSQQFSPELAHQKFVSAYFSPDYYTALGLAVFETFSTTLKLWSLGYHPENKSWDTNLLHTNIKCSSGPWQFLGLSEVVNQVFATRLVQWLGYVFDTRRRRRRRLQYDFFIFVCKSNVYCARFESMAMKTLTLMSQTYREYAA